METASVPTGTRPQSENVSLAALSQVQAVANAAFVDKLNEATNRVVQLNKAASEHVHCRPLQCLLLLLKCIFSRGAQSALSIYAALMDHLDKDSSYIEAEQTIRVPVNIFDLGGYQAHAWTNCTITERLIAYLAIPRGRNEAMDVATFYDVREPYPGQLPESLRLSFEYAKAAATLDNSTTIIRVVIWNVKNGNLKYSSADPVKAVPHQPIGQYPDTKDRHQDRHQDTCHAFTIGVDRKGWILLCSWHRVYALDEWQKFCFGRERDFSEAEDFLTDIEKLQQPVSCVHSCYRSDAPLKH